MTLPHVPKNPQVVTNELFHVFYDSLRLVGAITWVFIAHRSCGTCVNSKSISYNSKARTFFVETVPVFDNQIS